MSDAAYRRYATDKSAGTIDPLRTCLSAGRDGEQSGGQGKFLNNTHVISAKVSKKRFSDRLLSARCWRGRSRCGSALPKRRSERHCLWAFASRVGIGLARRYFLADRSFTAVCRQFRHSYFPVAIARMITPDFCKGHGKFFGGICTPPSRRK